MKNEENYTVPRKSRGMRNTIEMVEFDPNVPDWKWSDIEQKPVICGSHNELEQAQSALRSCLDAILDRFLNTTEGVGTQNGSYTENHFKDDLQILSEIQQYRVELCEKYKVSLESSFDDLNIQIKNSLENLNKKGEKENEASQNELQQK